MSAYDPKRKSLAQTGRASKITNIKSGWGIRNGDYQQSAILA